MSGAKPFEFGQTVLIFLALIGVCVWIGMIINSDGERKLVQACKPVEITTQFLHEASSALVGRQPTWTLYVQQYLMSGCYYFFSVIFSQHGSGLLGGSSTVDNSPPLGGIHN